MARLGAFLAVAALLVASAQGHAYLSNPRARNVVNWIEPQSLNVQSLCGTVAGTDYTPQNNLGVQASYNEGEAITINIRSTAFHKGYALFYLCDDKDNLTQECLDKYGPLMMSPQGDASDPRSTAYDYNSAHPERLELHKRCTAVNDNNVDCWDFGPGGYLTPHDITVSGIMLPEGVTCEECVLQWIYVTDTGTGERFWNCADVTITPRDGSTPAPTMAPATPAPTMAPATPAPTAAPDACNGAGSWNDCSRGSSGPCKNNNGQGAPLDYCFPAMANGMCWTNTDQCSTRVNPSTPAPTSAPTSSPMTGCDSRGYWPQELCIGDSSGPCRHNSMCNDAGQCLCTVIFDWERSCTSTKTHCSDA